ncbi:MAG: TMEM175 family protein [Planctomycetota bacterium]
MTQIKSARDLVQQGDKYFIWRGGDVSRLESLFDAVIALALTLIVVSVEVPDSFDVLKETFARLPAFAICFAILIMSWYYHFLFHRRYGLEDYPLVILNTVLMFLVVFYVYPLKFLYSALFDANAKVGDDDMPVLMLMYSGGFTAIFFLLTSMYVYAYFKRDGLELNETEVLLTKMKVSELSIYTAVGVASICMVFAGSPPLAGMTYMAIGPLVGLNGFFWGRYVREPEGDA